MRVLIGVSLAAVLLTGAGCKGDNWVKGEIGGEDFLKVQEAVFVGEMADDSADVRILMSTYDNACQNYQGYVQTQQYDADNQLVDEAHRDPRYLLFTVVLEGEDPLGEHPILAPGDLFGDGPSFINGRYRYADGEGQFNQIESVDGTLDLVEVDEDGNLVGGFSASWEGGDTLEGGFVAAPCDP